MFRKRGKAEGAGSVLRGMPFFEGFDDAELDRVAELADDVEADAGAVLTEQGKPGQECFIIRDGTANVYVGGEHINTLGPGTVVGEMALLSNRPRSATVVAETPMQLLVARHEGLPHAPRRDAEGRSRGDVDARRARSARRTCTADERRAGYSCAVPSR